MRSFLLVCLVAACGTDNPAPTADVTAATPAMLTPSDDAANDLTITVAYTDADGDLGGGSAEVHDCRADDLVTTLAIPDIAPPGVVAQHDKIAGSLDLHVDDIGDVPAAAMPSTCADLGVAALAASQTVFCVILVDTAGHRGTGDCTSAITLVDATP